MLIILKDTKLIQNKKPYLCQMRCLIKSLEKASKGKWTANYLGGNFHTFAEVNAYLKIHYKGNAPELVPFAVGALWMRFRLRLLMYGFPKKRFIVEIQQSEINHMICCYNENGKLKYYEPDTNEMHSFRKMKYKNIKGVWSLELPIAPPLTK